MQQFALLQNNTNNNNNNNMQPQQNQNQPNGNNNPSIQQQMTNSRQMQQYNQGQINQLNQMKQHFQQFQINQQPQQQQSPPQQINNNNQFQTTQSPPQNAMNQFSPPQNGINQQIQLNNQQNNVNNNNNFAQNQIQPAQNVNVNVWPPQQQQQNVIQLNGDQQQQQQQQQQQLNGNNNDPNATEEQKVQVEDSTLNPEVAEFNPASFGQPTLTIQEQLFNQLQTINVQMQNIKWKIENELNPTLLQINQNLLLFQTNPALLQLPQNQMQYFNLQQNQIIMSSQINQYQMTYKQLEANLKYTQDMYQKNKDEQYVVPIDDTIQPMTDQNINNGGQNNNPTFTLSQGVTDVSVTGGGWQPDTQVQVQNDIENNNENDMQPQNDTIEVQQQPNESRDSQENPPPIEQVSDNNENEVVEETQHTIKFMDVQEDENDNDNIPENNNENDIENNDEQEEKQEMNGGTNTTMPFSKFKASARQNSFGSAIISTPTTTTADDNNNNATPESQHTQEENENTRPITLLSHSKSDISYSIKQNNNLKPKPVMEKALSYSSQQSNESKEDDEEVPEEVINPGQKRFNVNDLLGFQKNYLHMNWGSYRKIYKTESAPPLQIRFITHGIDNVRYMEDVVAMFERKSANPWKWGEDYKCEKEKLHKKLTGVLNKMTPEKFTKIAKQTMDIVHEYANTKEEMNTIIGLVLQFGIKQPVFGDQYAKLCSHLQDFLPKLRMINESEWVANDSDLSQTFRKMVIQQTNDLFTRHRTHTASAEELKQWKDEECDYEAIQIKKQNKKNNFFAVMVLVAELYNVDLIKRNVVLGGVFDEVLKGPTSIDVEGLCRLFKRCGKKLDKEARRHVDKYLAKLGSHAGRFDFRTRVLVDEIKEMRGNSWEFRLKKEVAKTQQEIKEDFDREQAKGKGGRRDRRRDDYYDDYDNYAVGDYDDKGYHGYSTGNLKRLDRYGHGGGGGGGRRGDRRSQSSMNLRASNMRYNKKYDDHAWGNDDSVIGTSNGKYRQKYSGDKPGMNASKSYGTYQKKEKRGGLSRNKSDGYMNSGNSNDSVGSHGVNGHGKSYGDKETVHRVKGYIDEYMASGVIDEILQLNVNDFKVWASVINDGLRDRKSSEIGHFIELILTLFDEKILHNKSANFVNIVIKYLVIELDDNCMDCPNFVKYVAELFANLCYNQHLNPNPCYDYFIKKYKEYSEYMFAAKKKTISKVIKYSVNELKRLGAPYQLINNIQRKSL